LASHISVKSLFLRPCRLASQIRTGTPTSTGLRLDESGARQAGRSGERSRLHQRRRAHDCRRDASSREIFPPGVISIRSDCQAMRSFKRSARKLAGSWISFAAACTHEGCATARVQWRNSRWLCSQRAASFFWRARCGSARAADTRQFREGGHDRPFLRSGMDHIAPLVIVGFVIALIGSSIVVLTSRTPQ